MYCCIFAVAPIFAFATEVMLTPTASSKLVDCSAFSALGYVRGSPTVLLILLAVTSVFVPIFFVGLFSIIATIQRVLGLIPAAVPTKPRVIKDWSDLEIAECHALVGSEVYMTPKGKKLHPSSTCTHLRNRSTEEFTYCNDCFVALGVKLS